MKLFSEDIYFYKIELPLDSLILSEMKSWLNTDQSNYNEKRKQEYLAGRYCAIKAFEKVGVTLTELEFDKNRAPLWPKDYCGSISHTKKYAISVISKNLKSVGVDLEIIISAERFHKIKKMFCSEKEYELITPNIELYGTLIFSAKESLYKLINPLTKKYFGFKDATLISISNNEFTLELKSNIEIVKEYNGQYTGKYQVFDGHILTFLSLSC